MSISKALHSLSGASERPSSKRARHRGPRSSEDGKALLCEAGIDLLPPVGRLAFVNAVQPEVARDYLLPCVCDDVDALVAMAQTCVTLRDVVSVQLTRLDCANLLSELPTRACTDPGFKRLVAEWRSEKFRLSLFTAEQLEAAADKAGIRRIFDAQAAALPRNVLWRIFGTYPSLEMLLAACDKAEGVGGRRYYVVKKILTMLRRRGYGVEQKELDMNLAEFTEKFGAAPRRSVFSRLVQKEENHEDKLVVIFPGEGTLYNVSMLRGVVVRMKARGVLNALIVGERKLSRFALEGIELLRPKYNIECVVERDLTLDLLTDGLILDRKLCFLGSNLLELNMRRATNNTHDMLTGAGLSVVACRCPNLFRIDVGGWPFIGPCAILTLTRCSKLRVVDLSCTGRRCRNIDALVKAGERSHTDASIEKLVCRCHELVRLNLAAIGSWSTADDAPRWASVFRRVRGANVTDRAALALAAHGHKLEQLNLSNCRNVGTTGFVAIARGCTALTSLRLVGREPAPELLAALVKHRASSLVELKCGRADDVGTAPGFSPAPPRGLAELLKRCRALRGFSAERCELALRINQGIDGETRDHAEAASQWQMAAEEHHVLSQWYLGKAHELGEGVDKDLARSAYWWAKAAEGGHREAQCRLAYLYRDGDGVEQDMARAMLLWTSAAEHGHKEAQYALAVAYSRGNSVEKKDLARAVYWCTNAAEQGHGDAQYRLGFLYRDGEGVEKDMARAAHWWTEASKQGDQHAQYHLGVAYKTGVGVEKDAARAVHWWTEASKQGDQHAQYHLALMYAAGEGVAKDMTRAAHWWTKAADQGHG